MNNKTKYLLLFLICLIAALLRFIYLGSVPISPDWDEAALGYNAFSILSTGKDEYGKAFPLVLRSFDDYKPAMYAYLVIPFVKFFGLDVFAVRIPSALMGVITVVVTYFLTKELLCFGKKKLKDSRIIHILSLTAAFILALSPWHIQFSRIAFEANVAMGFNTFAFLFFFMGLRNRIFLSLSAFFAALSIYTYQSEKIYIPLIFISLLLIFRKHSLSISKFFLIIPGLIGFLVILPMIIVIVTDKQSLSRAYGVSIFSEKTPLLEKNVQKLIRHRENNDFLGLLFDNRRVVYFKTIFWGYISHFDLNWLFIKGDFDVDRHHAPNMGLLYLLEMPFFLVGIYVLVFNTRFIKINNSIRTFLILWLLITPIPASITTGLPHSVRTLNFLPAIQIIIALGMVQSVLFLTAFSNKSVIKLTIFIFFTLFFTFNFVYYLSQYFIQQNYYNARSWQYGYRELIEYLKPVRKEYKKIIVSNSEEMSQSYIFFLFYTKYDPKIYLSNGGTKTGGFLNEGNKFLNFEFRKFNYYNEKDSNILLIGSPSEFPETFKLIYAINYPNGKSAIHVVEKD